MNLQPYDQPTNVPVPKVQAVGAAGTIITALVAIGSAIGVTIPENVSTQAKAGVAGTVILISALQTIITFLAGYLKKDKKPVAAVKIIQAQGGK